MKLKIVVIGMAMVLGLAAVAPRANASEEAAGKELRGLDTEKVPFPKVPG